MIDTDKYEGHTPAPWTVTKHSCIALSEEFADIDAGPTRIASVVLDDNYELELKNEMSANAQLIADAPLILEDYERLRKEVMFLVNLEEFSTDERYIIQMEAEVKRLRKRNAWLEEVVGLAVEFDHIDLSDEGWPQWEGEEE